MPPQKRSKQKKKGARARAGGSRPPAGRPRYPSAPRRAPVAGRGPERPRPQSRRREPAPMVSAPPESVVQLLANWGDRAGAIQSKLTQYLDVLLRKNAEFNLTADRSPEDQWRKHVEDALLNARAIEQIMGAPGAGTRIVDVGSGGGMPGIVWAILWPAAHVTLVESISKKAAFLTHAARELGLSNVEVVNDRAEMVSHQAAHRESYDWASARALAAMPVLAEWTLPFVKIGGAVFAIKGAEIGDELKASRRATRLLGAPQPPQIHPYTRSDEKTSNLVILRKTDKSPSPYPRRAGIAQKSPL